MSFISAGDVIAAVRLGHSIAVKCLRTENQAAARLQTLISEIRYLGVQLEKLAEILDDATRQTRKASLPSRRRSIQPSGDLALVQTRSLQTAQIIGDFCKTLRECDAFLRKCAIYTSRGNQVGKTMRWYGTGLESELQQLRTRVQFHCTKIVFLIEPLQLELLNLISERVETILRYSRRTYDQLVGGRGANAWDLPPVPPSLARLYEVLSQNPAHRPFAATEPYPLDQSVDALLFHYSRSDVDGLQSHVSSSKQLNEFLKTQFILEKILAHPRLGSTTPLTRSIVARVEEKVRAQYENLRTEWIDEVTREICDTDTADFRIWFVEDLPAPPAPEHVAGFDEEKILEVQLSDDQQGGTRLLHVFRQSETELRLLETSATGPGTRQVISTHHWRCVPWIAAPNQPNSAKSLQLCHNKVHRGDLFTFKEDEDAFSFQQALTNYRVRYNSGQCRWHLQRQKLLYSQTVASSEKWSGIQLWEFEPLEDMEATDVESGEADTTRSPRSATLAGDLVAVLSGDAGSTMAAIQDVDGAGIIHSNENEPVLMIYTRIEGKLTYLYIPLAGDLDCNINRCGCKDLSSDCRIVVLENGVGKRKRFPLRVHHADGDDDWANWNLLLFAHPKPPAFASVPQWKDAAELTLEFSTPTERKIFQRELCRILRRRNQRRSRQVKPQPPTQRESLVPPRGSVANKSISSNSWSERSLSVSRSSDPPAQLDAVATSPCISELEDNSVAWELPVFSKSAPPSYPRGNIAELSPSGSLEYSNQSLDPKSPLERTVSISSIGSGPE